MSRILCPLMMGNNPNNALLALAPFGSGPAGFDLGVAFAHAWEARNGGLFSRGAVWSKHGLGHLAHAVKLLHQTRDLVAGGSTAGGDSFGP